jgi:DNA-binding NarL/FixJ family response regulator
LLTENGVDVVDQVGDADALLRSVRDLCPEIALVDIRMPPTHTDEGLRAAREIRSRYPGTAVLVLSQHLEPDYALQLVEEKPERVGYLMKERVGRIEQLLDAVQRVAAGECVVDRAVVDELLTRRAHVARARDPRADGRGPLQPGHLSRTLAQPEDRRDPHQGRFREARDQRGAGGQPPRARRAGLPSAIARNEHA